MVEKRDLLSWREVFFWGTCKVVTPRDPEFTHKLGFQGTQTATTATERRTTQVFCRGTGDFAQIPKSLMSKRQWRRSAPSDDTCRRKRKNRVEPSIYQLPQKKPSQS
jgi:hypothetical protein